MMNSIHDRLNKIEEKIKSTKFIEGHGLGNEVGFYIFDYHPKHELIVRQHIETLHNKFKSKRYGRKIIEFDLYKMLLEIAKEQRIFDQIFEMEANQGEDVLFTALTAFAKPEIFIDKIKAEVGDANVVFITGVGKIYPFVRSHTILNKLQEKLDTIPVIMFYPGEYDGLSLHLFGEFMDENYYRAFQLVDYK